MSLTVSMITMNEEGAIAKVVQDIRRVAPDAEILIVDSSKDHTPEIAAELGCRVLRQFPPKGYGPAMDRALREASGDVVLTMDCDDTYPVDAIPQFLAQIEAGADLVDGNRVWRRPPAMPIPNYLANRTFAIVARLLCRSINMDLHSGMRAYRKTMLNELTWDPNGPALPVELVLLPQLKGFRVVQLPIDYRERIGNTSLHRWNSTLWTFRRIWRMALTPRTRR